MTCFYNAKPAARSAVKLAAGIAMSLALASIAVPAEAGWGGRGDHRGYAHGFGGGYYAPPPVVYNGYDDQGGYYPPPVVYGPNIGIELLRGVAGGVGRGRRFR